MRPKKEKVKVEKIKEEIEGYTEEVLKKNVRCPYDFCPQCGGKRPEKGFKWAGLRARVFYLVLEALVEKVRSFLTRWLCPRCKSRFTYYPPFAIPKKRYVRQEIEERSLRYVEKEELSYRKASKDRGMACGYKESEKQLSHSTVHRWLGFLGAQAEMLRNLLSFITESLPHSGLHRLPLPIHPSKYRTRERKEVLQIARRLLHAQGALRAFLGTESFPDFATVGVVK
ncbi:MAG: hypothetical protein DRN21_06440 [Thermoplasmata archaeon]|nr:MAG: hypothetical protein DRN21_06440 [Thermoplasmata archaeon]